MLAFFTNHITAIKTRLKLNFAKTKGTPKFFTTVILLLVAGQINCLAHTESKAGIHIVSGTCLTFNGTGFIVIKNEHESAKQIITHESSWIANHDMTFQGDETQNQLADFSSLTNSNPAKFQKSHTKGKKIKPEPFADNIATNQPSPKSPEDSNLPIVRKSTPASDPDNLSEFLPRTHFITSGHEDKALLTEEFQYLPFVTEFISKNTGISALSEALVINLKDRSPPPIL